MINNYVEYEYQACHLIHAFDEDKKHSLFLGDVSSALDLDFIHRSNIKTVVTAAAGMDQVAYSPSDNIKHIIYAVLDHKSQNLIKYFDDFFQLVQRQIKNGSILVHCAAGISRSSSLVISYFIKKNNWSFKEAIKYVRDIRPMVLPNLGFERQLKQYEKITQQQQNRRLKSKTSESNKHSENRMIEILPDIGFLGVKSTKNKVLEAFRIYKKEDDNQKINRRNFMFNNHILRNENKVNSLKYQQLNKFKPHSRQFGQTKSVSLQQGLERNFRNSHINNEQPTTKVMSYGEIKTDQGEGISSRVQNRSRNGLFDSAIIPIKYNTVNKNTDKLKKTNMKFGPMNGNILGINKMNIFKQKYAKNSPTLSLGKVGLHDVVEVMNNNDMMSVGNGVENNKTRMNFPTKLSKVKQSQSQMNYPIAIGRKDISVMKREFWPMKKQVQNKDDQIKFGDDLSRKINIKNLLFYHND